MKKSRAGNSDKTLALMLMGHNLMRTVYANHKRPETTIYNSVDKEPLNIETRDVVRLMKRGLVKIKFSECYFLFGTTKAVSHTCYELTDYAIETIDSSIFSIFD